MWMYIDTLKYIFVFVECVSTFLMVYHLDQERIVTKRTMYFAHLVIFIRSMPRTVLKYSFLKVSIFILIKKIEFYKSFLQLLKLHLSFLF